MKQQLAIGIDLGGTNLRIALVNRDGLILDKSEQRTLADRGPDAVIADIAASVRGIIDSAGLDPTGIAAVGVCTPGPLDLRAGRIIHAANLPGWKDVPIRSALAEKLRLPVVLENDGNAAAFGEFRAGAGRGSEDLVMLTLGTGVGAGIILNGRILHGHFDNAAELGHMIVVVDGLPCPCGQRGCLERYASAEAVVRRVREAVQNRDSPGAVNPGRDTQGAATLRAEDVARGAADGDSICKQVWDEACLYLAVACINIQHFCNPARIILGGGMSLAGERLLGGVHEALRAQAWTLHDDLPAVELSSLGADAGLIGSAALAFDHR